MAKNDVISAMESNPSLYKGKGVSTAAIKDAENQLGVTFADDFRAFLSHYGYALTNGHEILGLGESPDLVEATITERSRGHDVERGWYVLEVADIDDIVVWQETSGTVYQTVPHGGRISIARNLADYLNS
jgi:hypothetical protein